MKLLLIDPLLAVRARPLPTSRLEKHASTLVHLLDQGIDVLLSVTEITALDEMLELS